CGADKVEFNVLEVLGVRSESGNRRSLFTGRCDHPVITGPDVAASRLGNNKGCRAQTVLRPYRFDVPAPGEEEANCAEKERRPEVEIPVLEDKRRRKCGDWLRTRRRRRRSRRSGTRDRRTPFAGSRACEDGRRRAWAAVRRASGVRRRALAPNEDEREESTQERSQYEADAHATSIDAASRA